MSNPCVFDTLRDRVILVTGGAGFLASVILYRLLTEDIDTRPFRPRRIYTIVRAKKDMDPSQVWKRLPRFLHEHVASGRLVVVAADCNQINFGFSKDPAWMSEIEIVLHTAADTKFHIPLEQTVNINTTMAYVCANFSMTHANVKTHVHISTCYTMCNLPDQFHAFEELASHQRSFDDFANPYSQAKMIGEGIVNAFAQTGRASGIAWSVLRINTLSPALKYPHQDFGVNGTSSPMVAVLSAETFPDGLLSPIMYLDVLPVDVAAEQIIALTCATHLSPRHARFMPNGNSVQVYNVANPSRPTWPLHWNPPHVKLARPVIPWRALVAVYKPIMSKLTVLRTDKARGTLGLPPLKLQWDVPEAQVMPMSEAFEAVVKVDPAGLMVDPERAIDEEGGWENIFARLKTKLDAAAAARKRAKNAEGSKPATSRL